MNYLKTIGIVISLIVVVCGSVKIYATQDVVENSNKVQDDVKSEVRNVSGFSKIDIGGTIVGNITVGKDFSVVVEAKEQVLSEIITKVEDNTLKVKFEKGFWKRMKKKYRNTKAKVTISLPMLEDLDVSGASRVSAVGVNSDKFNLDVSGASSVNIEGSAREIIADISGASSLRASKLLSEVMDMDLSGASSARVNVSTELRVDASGASSVRYTGEPSIEKDTSGASSVRRMK